MKEKRERKAVVVTTAHRGVFFGYAAGVELEDKTVRIEEAQMCVYWSSDVRGVIGLAANGPSETCKIGPSAPAITLTDVTAVMEASKKAEEAWKSAPWR